MEQLADQKAAAEINCADIGRRLRTVEGELQDARRETARVGEEADAAKRESASLSTRFASQWLRLQDVEKIHPDALLFPSFDNCLAESYTRETQLFFDSIVKEDRNVLDLLTADYTFVNERIARVYRHARVAVHEERDDRIKIVADVPRRLVDRVTPQKRHV